MQEMAMTDDDNKAKKQKFSPDNETIDDESAGTLWWSIPEPVLINILRRLEPQDILNASATCRRWYEVANDNILWKHKFQEHFRTDPSIPLKPGNPIRFFSLVLEFCNNCLFFFSKQVLPHGKMNMPALHHVFLSFSRNVYMAIHIRFCMSAFRIMVKCLLPVPRMVMLL